MKLFKQTMKLLVFTLFLSLTSCGQEKYPNLEDGLYAEIITNKGTMVAQLFYDQAPVTVANFVALAEGTHPNVADSLKGKPFYNGLTFHRVMDKFMIQGGDILGSGAGGPGYTFGDEFSVDLRHDKPGILSMGNRGVNTNGSQFFITEAPTPWLDGFDANGNLKNCADPRVGCHNVFGELVIGLEVQDTISNVEVNKSNNKPLEPVVIQEINIIRKGEEASAFDAAVVYAEKSLELEEKLEKTKAEEAQKAKESAEIAAQSFIENNADLPGPVKEFDSGLIMIYISESNGVKPRNTDRVLINYAGFFEDGRIFDTSWAEVAKENNVYNEQRDQQGGYKPIEDAYNETARVVPGFREAMLNMNIGDKVRIFIPSYLGWGAQGSGPIPPNANVIFDMELVGIK
jgi:cyclophilin family peptidyl-prolyl cis-trans isomerase